MFRSPLLGDTVPERVLVPAASAALSRPVHSTIRTGSQASGAAELRAMRRQLDEMHAVDPEKQGGKIVASDNDRDITPYMCFLVRDLEQMVCCVARQERFQTTILHL